MNLFDGTAHELVAWDLFGDTEYFVGRIVAIDVCGDKIHGNVLLCRMGDEITYPCCLSGRGPSHAQTRAHDFQIGGRMVVKFPVSRLLGLPGPEVEIRFIPDLEVPFRHLINSVSTNQMLGELRD